MEFIFKYGSKSLNLFLFCTLLEMFFFFSFCLHVDGACEIGWLCFAVLVFVLFNFSHDAIIVLSFSLSLSVCLSVRGAM